MANPGVGTKFVSVNLNKSYGQHHHNDISYGSSRSRGSIHGTSGSGGGMAVLSRPRSSHKAAGPKLSVPPPLNLPSLRKEHEKFDLSASGGGTAGGGVSGSGMRPGSSGMRWTKPVAAPLPEKDGLVISDRDASVGIDQDMQKGINGVNQGSSLYTPPSARMGSAGPVVSAFPAVEKVSVLRGEDFPSLRATLAATSGPVLKQKDGLNQKQKRGMGDEPAAEQKESSQSTSFVEMLPQPQALRSTYSGRLHENGNENQRTGGSSTLDQRKKRDDFFSGPLPLVQFNPRSDWADDERDTSHSLLDRSRDLGFSKGESYWDGDFDMPKASVFPQKAAYNSFNRLGQRDNEAGKISSSEVSKADPYGRSVRMPSREGREGYSWRTSSPLSGDGVSSQEARSERNNYSVRPSGVVMDTRKENKNVQLPVPDVQDDFGRKESMSGHWRLPWNKEAVSFSNHGTERITRDRYGGEQYNKYDGFQNNSVLKSSFGVKGFPSNDPIRGLARDNHCMSKTEKPYLGDPFLKDVDDDRDPLSGGLVGVLKRKKDVLKQTDFHDPVRESFEAELERVQKLQEQERQRIIEEQERAIELARREEEERMRLAREQEERQRRLEEEAREAAWRAEQERLEALRRAEEQRIAREEEKRRIIMEEERRKQAAKQKLLELEERMAKRRAEAEMAGSNSSMVDENVLQLLKEKDVSQLPDGGVWDESERMVEMITTSSASDSSSLNRLFEVSSRSNPSHDTSSIKPANTWRRDPFDSGTSLNLVLPDQDVPYGPKRDASFGGRGFQRKEFHGGAGYVSSRNYPKGGMPEPPMDEFPPMRRQRWNLADGDHYGKNTDVETEFLENFSERLGDMDWGQSRAYGNTYSSYPEQFYQNPELEGPCSFGRARYSMRQPRVLPPPSVTSIQKSSPYRGEIDRPGPSAFLQKEIHYNTTTRNESTMQMGYDGGRGDILEDKTVIKQEVLGEQRMDQSREPRCDSQSSLSVSSPPDSPVHLSHDDLDESGDYPAKSALEDNSDFLISDDGAVHVTSGQENTTCSLSGDDGEWTVENNEHLQEQEEYDEDEEGYREEDEMREGDDGNVDLSEEFENMQLEDNMVLGFNDNVEVCVTNEEFEKSSKNEGSAYAIPLSSCGSVEETLEKKGTVEQTHQLTDGSAQVSMGGSSFLPDNGKVTQNISTGEFVVTPATSESLNSVDASQSSLPIQPSVPSSSSLVFHSSGHTLLHSSPAVAAQMDLPIKLQFGLFSGPPLIPSAVPAIQIGSIQMPLHLNPQIGTALGPMQQSQPPIFQFGQLRYASPISPGVVPVAPQTVSLVQSTNLSVNQKPGGPMSMQSGQDLTSAESLIKNDALSFSVDEQSGLTLRYVDQPLGNTLNAGNRLQTGEKAESMVPSLQKQVDYSQVDGSGPMGSIKAQEQEHRKEIASNYRAFSNSKDMAGKSQIGWTSSQSVKNGKDLNGSKVPGPVTSSRGKRYIFKVKNPAARTSLQDTEVSYSDSAGCQRKIKRTVKRAEFRVREIGEKRQSSGFDSPNDLGADNRSNVSTRYTVVSARSATGKSILSNKHVKQTSESEGTTLTPGNTEEETGSTDQTIQQPHFARGDFKRSSPSKDVDAPLQSGIVRVFEQPGIEVPSDEDDFIEVRSKRQMLIDKREQREKEIKAKSRVMKIPRKPRYSQSNNGLAVSKKTSSVRNGERETHADFVQDGRGSSNLEVSVGFKTSVASQLLAPIGTPAMKSEAQSDTRPQKFNSLQVGSSAGQNLGAGLIFESKNKALDNVQTSLDAWGSSGINQQVMALTQSQLDDAMKPAQFDSRTSGNHIVSVTEPVVSSTSMLTKDKSFSSAASPINSLLAGEKIQFGAVTSPTVLPPSSHAVSLGIGPPGPCRPEIQLSHKLPAVESGCNLFFEKENNSDEACARLEDCEAEAEAAASAIAVAAISNDDIVGNGLGACSISASDAKTFSAADVHGITGVNADKQLANQSQSEEPLNVSLPADLSVETPPISLWPSLSSSQNTSSPMVSHFPGGRPSLLPFYEMNPMMASPIFAFGPNEESTSMQSQSQKSSTTSSGLPGTWPHSGVDSFYGPPAGFTGPFISPGGMPGVQGPPHMVVYNHFAPVSQFGQVGLSFMGTAFIPSGKQPDWKHNPASSPMIGEGDANNLNLVSAQRNASSVPPPVQHLAPGSPLLPLASPLAMFDVSPFQSSPEMSVHARWSHVPASPLQSVPMSMPTQQGEVGGSQFNSMPSIDQSIPVNRFTETRSSTPSGSTHNCIESTDANSNQLPDELGLVDPTSSSSAPSTQSTVAKLSSLDVTTDTCNANVLNTSNSSLNTSSSMKNHSSQQKNVSNQYYSSSSGFNYQRGSASQKNNPGGEWPHRRTGFQGRNNSFGAEKNFSSTKVKQIYVAKQTIGGKSAT